MKKLLLILSKAYLVFIQENKCYKLNNDESIKIFDNVCPSQELFPLQKFVLIPKDLTNNHKLAITLLSYMYNIYR